MRTNALTNEAPTGKAWTRTMTDAPAAGRGESAAVPRASRPALPRAIGILLVTSGAAWLAATPARADFRICNASSTRVSVALAYTDGQTWEQEGWWNLKGSGCETLLHGPLAAQFYYIYAMDERGGEWKGKAFMCTSNVEFKIEGRDNCFVRGYERTGFFEIDTGKDAKDWTVQLTDPQKPPAQP